MGRVRKIHYAGYGLGDLANGLTFGMSSVFLLSFYTDVLGITAKAAGTLFLAARLWDGINDPLMGNLADRLFKRREKRRGAGKDKFRPFLLWGSWPVAAAAILMFFAPENLTGGQKLVWAYVSYILWGMCYTFVNIPYGSLASVMTREPVERSILSVARGVGSLAGLVIPRVLVPLVLVRFGEGQDRGYLTAMAVIGILTFLLYLLSWGTTFEDPRCRQVHHSPPREKKGPPGILKNRPFLALCLASLSMLTGMMINGAMNIYYFRENLNALELMAFSGVVMILPALGAILIIPSLVKRFGVAFLSARSALLSALCWSALFLLPSRPLLYIGGSMAAYLFLMIPNMTVWALVSDCIDYQEELTGERREGTIYGSYSFVRKTGQAMAGFLSGAGLSLIGYRAELAQQSPRTLGGIKFLSLGLPALCLFVTYLSYRFIWNRPEESTLKKELPCIESH
ncbi:MAG: glycoside-pentoside-hexuronide (GPH):cation symporter [Spirochaetales bacterium]|nr:glycoside-pentoside-hexuronide (GPH):cation symporter [Spirochaetales bacterium]